MNFRRGGTARSLGTIAGAALLLGGCTQGPNFFSPAPPEEKAYTGPNDPVPPSDDPGVKSRAAQRVAVGAKVRDDWWALFHSAPLDQVMRQAIADSPTIAQATATLAQAREQIIATAGGLLPQVDLAASVGRQQFNAAPSGVDRVPVPVNVYSVGPSVSYALDVFGSIKRQVEAQAALADVSDYQLAAAYLSLSGNITNQAITIAGLRAQIKTVDAIIADDQKNLDLVKTAQAGGTATMVDVTTAQTQLANDRALLPPLRQQLSVARDALTVYAGRVPADWSAPDFELTSLTLPSVVPVSLPSALVRQRPDILAAEAQLHAAAAQLGVATANLYPNFTLTANVTQGATQIGKFFSGMYTGYDIAASMAAPIFHGGTLSAEQRAARDALNASWAAYRGTVISAFGQVADQLQALVHDDEAVKAQQAAVAVADQALRLARLSYEAGNSTFLQLLDPQRQREQAQLGLVRAQTQRLIDTAQLLVALGSGWWNTPPAVPGPEPDPHALVPGSPTSSPALPETQAPDEAPFWTRWFGGA
ncbi:MAG TPA: efflux transporter outer membrane subunit [Stellaceae bacterium]|nr:efflux transporter outer membrane subunit [Stellaceae bacterium]